jgi:hypothetical protein
MIEATTETAQQPHPLTSEQADPINHAAVALLDELSKVPDGPIVAEMVTTALKLLRDQTNRGDIKLINTSLKEMRYALKVFAPYRDIRKCSIFGSARTP